MPQSRLRNDQRADDFEKRTTCTTATPRRSFAVHKARRTLETLLHGKERRSDAPLRDGARRYGADMDVARAAQLARALWHAMAGDSGLTNSLIVRSFNLQVQAL